MTLPNYEDGYKVFDKLKNDGIEIQERGFGSSKNTDGSYNFFVSCKINEYSKNQLSLNDNESIKNKKIEEAYNTAISTIKRLHNNGQDSFVINMNLPNYEDGFKIFDKLKNDGIEIQERGFASSKKWSNGSYNFSVSCKISEHMVGNL